MCCCWYWCGRAPLLGGSVLSACLEWTMREHSLQRGSLVARRLTSCTLCWVLERLQARATRPLCTSLLRAVQLRCSSCRRHRVCVRHAALTVCRMECTLPRPSPAPNPVCSVLNTVSTLHRRQYSAAVACGDMATLDSRTHSLRCMGRPRGRFRCATMEHHGGCDRGTLPASLWSPVLLQRVSCAGCVCTLIRLCRWGTRSAFWTSLHALRFTLSTALMP